MARLDGKVCVITGAASGIGAETAKLFKHEGATVVGVDLSENSEGDLAIQADVTDEDQVRDMYARAREEIFGPVACVIPFADEREAVAIANDTIYGLSGSIWTRDGAKALRVARRIETGVLSINSNTSVRVATPFGGFKQSGVGRELGPDALEHYTEVKNVFYATEAH